MPRTPKITISAVVFMPPATITPTTAPTAMPGPPAAQDRPVDRALLGVGAHRALRGEDDGGERGGEADLHDLRPVVAEGEEGVEEGRHQHDAAADPEEPGDHPGDGADDDEERDERQELREVGHRHGGRGSGRRGPLP